MADRTLHRHGSAHAVADKVRSRDLEIIEQCGHVVGEVFVGDISWDVRRAAVTLLSTAMTFRVLESSLIHPAQLLVMVMNAP